MDALKKNLRTALSSKDGKLLVATLTSAAKDGVTDRQCFRVALAVDPTLTHNEWEDLKLEGQQ